MNMRAPQLDMLELNQQELSDIKEIVQTRGYQALRRRIQDAIDEKVAGRVEAADERAQLYSEARGMAIVLKLMKLCESIPLDREKPKEAKR